MSLAAAEPPAKPAKPAPKPITDPNAARKFAEGLVGKQLEPEKKKEPETPEPEIPEPTPKPKAQKPKPAPVTAPTPALTSKDISEAVAEGVKLGSKKELETEPVEKTLPPIPAKRLVVLERMEKNSPEKYKGKAKAYHDSIIKLMEYSEDWKAANPGKDFDEEDDEHKAFFDKNEVDWDEDDYTEAMADMRADEKIGAFKKETDQKFATVERAEKLRSEAPKIAQAQTTAALSFFGEMDGEFAKVLKPDGKLDEAVYTKLQESDPIAHSIVITSAQTLEALAQENYKLFTNLADFEPKNPLHVTISNFVLSKEAQLLAKPKEKQMDENGRQFLSADAYWKLGEKERAKHWTFGREHIDALLTSAVSAQVKQQIKTEEEKFRATAKARGITIAEAKQEEAEAAAVEQPAPVVKKKPVEEDDEPVDEPSKPSSPSSSSQPRVAPSGGAAKPEDGKSRFAKRFIS